MPSTSSVSNHNKQGIFRLGLHADEKPQPLDPVLRFKPGEALEPRRLEQKVDPLDALRLLLALRPLAPGRLVPARVRPRDVRLLRGGQAAPLLVRDLAVQRGVHGVHDVLERQVGQRGAAAAVRGERGADDLQVDGPLRDHVAHDAHARHLRVRRGLLEVVRVQRRDARARARAEHQVRVDKVEVDVRRDDRPVDQIVQLRPRQLHRRECRPAGGVGEVWRRDGRPWRRGDGRWLHWDKCSVKRVPPRARVIWVEQRRLINWRCHGRSRWRDGKKCR